MTVVRHINHEVQDWDRLRNRLVDDRRERGLDQDRVAERAGFSSRTTLGRIERGESVPGIDSVIALARVYGLSVELATPLQRRVLSMSHEDLIGLLRRGGLA